MIKVIVSKKNPLWRIGTLLDPNCLEKSPLFGESFLSEKLQDGTFQWIQITEKETNAKT